MCVMFLGFVRLLSSPHEVTELGFSQVQRIENVWTRGEEDMGWAVEFMTELRDIAKPSSPYLDISKLRSFCNFFSSQHTLNSQHIPTSHRNAHHVAFLRHHFLQQGRSSRRRLRAEERLALPPLQTRALSEHPRDVPRLAPFCQRAEWGNTHHWS